MTQNISPNNKKAFSFLFGFIKSQNSNANVMLNENAVVFEQGWFWVIYLCQEIPHVAANLLVLIPFPSASVEVG